MRAVAAGQILCGSEGRVYAGARENSLPSALRNLASSTFPASASRSSGAVQRLSRSRSLAGPSLFRSSGRAVIIAIDRQRYLLPRDTFLAFALGEDLSCSFFKSPENEPEIETIPPRKGGEAS